MPPSHDSKVAMTTIAAEVKWVNGFITLEFIQ